MKKIVIEGRSIGDGFPPYVIAEMSANHNGSLERALDTISMAKKMGADAVKMQTYTADTITIKSDRPEFQLQGGLWDGFDLYSLYEWARTPFEWHKPVFEHARKTGITCFSTPFDQTAVDLLEDLNAPAYKIASFEIVDIPLVRYVATTGKPMILSTGMAARDEIAEAVETARDAGCQDIVLLHCTSGYPTPMDQSNLRMIQRLQNDFDVVAGLSDHTLGTAVPVAAVALGAHVIEKHFTLDKADKGPDSEFSIDPAELMVMSRQVKDAWLAIGVAQYQLQQVEQNSIQYRRSLYVVEDVRAGQKVTKSTIRSIRPGLGLAPKFYDDVIGRTFKQDVSKGTPLCMVMIE